MVKPSLFIKKSLTALVLAPMAVYLVYDGYPGFHMALLIAGALLSWEWAHMVPNKKPDVYALSYFLSLIFMLFIGPWVVALCGLTAIAAFISFKARKEERRSLLIFGSVYISVGLGMIAFQAVSEPFVFLWILLCVWCTDIGGYAFGCTLKGPKLAPTISPNKTWSGFIGGMILAMIASFAYFYYVFAGPQYYVFDRATVLFVFTGGYVAILAQVGDLLESAIKRRLIIKDSSDIIPGHGGMFDRMDSLLFAVPAFVLTAFLVDAILSFIGYYGY